MNSPALDIFIKSYAKDFDFLKYCLKSIAKYVTGYRKICIAIPDHDCQIYIQEFGENFEGLPINVFYQKEYGSGYLYQQFVKMTAYKYTDAEYIMFVDSDCMFYASVDIAPRPEEKILRLFLPYGIEVYRDKWKLPTEKWIGCAVANEYMCGHPFLYLRNTLVKLHASRPNLEREIMEADEFSEFNALGIWTHLNESDFYEFVNVQHWQRPPALVIQFWSWGGIDSVRSGMKALLNEKA
jgi:hypothetical protein